MHVKKTVDLDDSNHWSEIWFVLISIYVGKLGGIHQNNWIIDYFRMQILFLKLLPIKLIASEMQYVLLGLLIGFLFFAFM